MGVSHLSVQILNIITLSRDSLNKTLKLQLFSKLIKIIFRQMNTSKSKIELSQLNVWSRLDCLSMLMASNNGINLMQ